MASIQHPFDQTAATVEQAHAAWAQVWVSGISALETLMAVGAALAIPAVQWWRQRQFTESTLLQAVRAVVMIHQKLETELITFSPAGGLSVVRVARQRLDHTIPIVREYRMITCLLALSPFLERIESALEDWELMISSGNNFDIDAFRKGMRVEAEKVRAVLVGYGRKGLLSKLDQPSP
jgi:hypothetical protein